ncbi:ATP-binding cassette domain-containing protein [Candidatus Babeliales bacterium]|nr:ATP-binding cassette domain-containing protein [Candidatus Babeliales bacterium]
MSFLKVSNLSQFYGKKEILKNISFYTNLGEVVALLGPNGAGKTTLLRSVMGFLPISKYNAKDNKNAVHLSDQLINNFSVSKRVENGLAYLPQQTSLFLQLSALDNLRMVYEYHDYWRSLKADGLKSFNSEMHKWLEKTSLTNILSQKCFQLSGGQKRKLEVVRSLLMHPKIIMFDEPFAGVDPKSIYELKSIFIDLAKNGIAIVISDHHVDQLLSIANRIYVIVGGEVVVSGGIKDIMDNKYTREMYLGSQFYSEMSKKFLD